MKHRPVNICQLIWLHCKHNAYEVHVKRTEDGLMWRICWWDFRRIYFD